MDWYTIGAGIAITGGAIGAVIALTALLLTKYIDKTENNKISPDWPPTYDAHRAGLARVSTSEDSETSAGS